MCWKPARSITPIARLWRTLAFRLTAGYALAGLILVILATAGLYFVLVSELDNSTELFLGDKLNVLRTMVRDRPNDQEALQEEVELETAARRYEQFYIRLLDDRNTPLLTTPGMAEEDQTWGATLSVVVSALVVHASAWTGAKLHPFS